ncbi:BnaC09g20400D [Brassica napus]|uniref:BnaC09g20400D protein n=1 Tax=Brassica napus TaxID=3708 RepID=A0A078GLA9_BRANA|nr:BnaC09g20400D [Brassica napus]
MRDLIGVQEVKKVDFKFKGVNDDNSNGSPTETTPIVGSAVEYITTVEEDRSSSIYEFLYPRKEELPNDKEMAIFYHLEELWERIFVSVLAVGAVITGCFAFSKDLIVFLEAPVKTQGVRFLQLAPGKFFFYYSKSLWLLWASTWESSDHVLYEIIAFVLPGLIQAERSAYVQHWLVFPGSSNSVTTGTSRGGVGRSNAFDLEICGGGCGGCSGCSHSLDGPCYSDVTSNAASGALLGWCMYISLSMQETTVWLPRC